MRVVQNTASVARWALSKDEEMEHGSAISWTPVNEIAQKCAATSRWATMDSQELEADFHKFHDRIVNGLPPIIDRFRNIAFDEGIYKLREQGLVRALRAQFDVHMGRKWLCAT